MKKNNKYPIRIAYVIGKMWAGGVEAVVFNYYRAIDHSKIQFDFYYDEDSTVDPPKDLIDMGARFFVLPPYQKLPKYIKQLRSHFKKEKYLIVHSHLNTISFFPLYVAWREKIPIRIAHNHSVPGGNEYKRNLIKGILRHFSKVFATDYYACSEKAGRWMFGNKTFDRRKVHVMKNALDFRRFIIPDDEITENKKRLNLNNSFVIGHVGRFTYAKNHLFLIDVFCEVLKKQSNAKLLLVGDGELHDQIIEEIKKKGIDSSVVLTGKVNNPELYYPLVDVVVVPSVFEGLSLTTVEAQVARKPVVISRAIPSEAIISNGCTYRSLEDTAERWADTILSVKDLNVELTNESRKYDISIQVKKLERWYIKRIARFMERVKRTC